MNWDFSCCRSTWEALVWAAPPMSIDMGGARLGREPAIGPALHLCYWPIQIETFFFIFYIAFSCVRTNKTSTSQSRRLKLGAHFLATRGGHP